MNKKTFLVAVLILILDQVSKSVIEILVGFEKSIKVIDGFFKLTSLHNTGGAWSILNDHGLFFIIASILAIIILLKFMFSFKENKRNILAFGLLFGGILSNLADRIFLGYVRDFLDFKIFNYDFPVFNIADIAIVLGVVLLILAILKGEDKNAANN